MAVTGQTVVSTGMVLVTTTVPPVPLAGQSVMVGAQLVIVCTSVVYFVEVVSVTKVSMLLVQVVVMTLAAELVVV